MADDLGKWMDALRGRPDAGADARETAHAEEVRKYFQRRIAEDALGDQEDPAKRDRLISYLQSREEVLPNKLMVAPTYVAPPKQRKASNAMKFALVAGFSALAAAVPLFHLLKQGDTGLGENEALVLRGGSPMQIVRTDSPSRLADEIERRLDKTGVTIKRENIDQDTVTLSGQVEPAQLDGARRDLAELGVTMGNDGRFLVTLVH